MRYITAVDSYSQSKDTQAIVRECFKLIYNSNPAKNINDSKVFLEAGHAANLDNDLLQQCVINSTSDEIKMKLKWNTKEALEYGAFGLPSIVVFTATGPKFIFGSDKLELIAHLIGEKYLGPCP